MLTISDHCPLTAVVSVNVNTRVDSSDYEFITKPSKLAWDNNISYRFENLLQTEEFSFRFSAFLNQELSNDQVGIDQATDNLSELLIEGAMRSSQSLQHNRLKKPSVKLSTKKIAKKRRKHPKWHDKSCADAHRDVVLTSKLLKGDPKNPYLKGKLVTETKTYNRLVKSKHKEFVDKMFSDLESIKRNDPKGYIDLVKSMRDGNFDREMSDDTSDISPQIWFNHFSKLLAKNGNLVSDFDHQTIIDSEIDLFKTELDHPFTKTELLNGLKGLKNNKASSFDQISNEMLKVGGNIIIEPLLKLFNSILTHSLYPSAWKQDILNPIHKSGVKDDPNNFRGIAIASCFGKLFTTLLRNRLQTFCDKGDIISKFQGSGKSGSRTADNHMILKFLLDKIVKGKRKNFFVALLI